MIYANSEDYNGDGTFSKTHMILDGHIDQRVLEMTTVEFADGELCLCSKCAALADCLFCQSVTVLSENMMGSHNGTTHCAPLFYDILIKKGLINENEKI